MKIFFFSSMVVLACFGCNNPFCENAKQFEHIDPATVERIVKIDSDDRDTVILDEKAKEDFILKFNTAWADCMYKYIPQQVVVVTLKNSTQRKFRINGDLIKEDSDYCMNALLNFFDE